MDAIQIGIVQTGVLLLFFFVLRSGWSNHRTQQQLHRAADRLKEQQEAASALHAHSDAQKRRADSYEITCDALRLEMEVSHKRIQQLQARHQDPFGGPFEVVISDQHQAGSSHAISGKLLVRASRVKVTHPEMLRFETGIPSRLQGWVPNGSPKVALEVLECMWQDVRIDYNPYGVGPRFNPVKVDPVNSFRYHSPGYKIQKLEMPVQDPVPVDESQRGSVSHVGFWTGDPAHKSSQLVAFYGLGGSDPALQLTTPVTAPKKKARFMTLHVHGTGNIILAGVRVESATE